MYVRSLSVHTRFILTRGVVPWGMIVGIAAAAIVLRDAYLAPKTSSSSAGQIIVLAVLGFLEWSLGAGWVIGAVLWTVTRSRTSETSGKDEAP